MSELRSEKPADYWEAYMELREKRMQLQEAFPVCISETKNNDDLNRVSILQSLTRLLLALNLQRNRTVELQTSGYQAEGEREIVNV